MAESNLENNPSSFNHPIQDSQIIGVTNIDSLKVEFSKLMITIIGKRKNNGNPQPRGKRNASCTRFSEEICKSVTLQDAPISIFLLRFKRNSF